MSEPFTKVVELIEDIKIERYGNPLKAALHLCNDLADEIARLRQEQRPEANATQWRDPKDKPENMPGKHHSADVLIVMHDPFDGGPAIRIGHVSLGHWRPRGGNGNFDNDVLAWMPMPEIPSPLPQSLPEEKK